MANARRALRDYERSLNMTTNNNNTATASTSGIGIFGLLTAILLVFKLAGMAGASWGLANLSWFWVFAPLGFGIALALLFMLIAVVIVMLASR